MECSGQNQEQITSLAAGELAAFRAWLLRRHFRACPACRAQWKQTKSLWAGLQAMASEPASTPLRARVFARFPLVTPQVRRQASMITIGGIVMNRRTFAAMSAILLLVVTGALAARLIPHRAGGAFGEPGGRVWEFSTNFRGKMTIFNAQGRLVGQFRSDGGDPNGDVAITVAGLRREVQGLGRHDVLNARGTLIGYAVLDSLSSQDVIGLRKQQEDRMPSGFEAAARWERQHLTASGGASGIDTYPIYVAGFDKARGVFWMMRGLGMVTVTQPDGGKSVTGQARTGLFTPEQRKTLPPEFQASDQDIETPQFILSVGGRTTHEQGYGAHIVRDAHGKPLLILKAEPPASTQQ